MARKKRRPKPKPALPLPRPLVAGLDEAHELFRLGRLAEARDLLESLDRRFPRWLEVVEFLANVAFRLRDARALESAAERLTALQPNAARPAQLLARAHLLNGHVVLALGALRRFLDRWPNDLDATELRGTADKLQADLDDYLAHQGLTGEGALEAAALHERTEVLFNEGRYGDARRSAEEVLRLRPGFLPALNNIAESWLRDDRLDEAAATARRALDLDPDNVHALSNLTRFLFFAGRRDEAIMAVPDDFADEISIVGPPSRIKERLEAWRNSPVTTLMVAGRDPEQLELVRDLVRG